MELKIRVVELPERKAKTQQRTGPINRALSAPSCSSELLQYPMQSPQDSLPHAKRRKQHSTACGISNRVGARHLTQQRTLPRKRKWKGKHSAQSMSGIHIVRGSTSSRITYVATGRCRVLVHNIKKPHVIAIVCGALQLSCHRTGPDPCPFIFCGT